MLRRPNSTDRAALELNLLAYQEIPPVVRYPHNNWGGEWTGAYASEPPLRDAFGDDPVGRVLQAIESDSPGRAFGYGYLCGVVLR